MNKGFCPTQARVILLFEKLPCKFHMCYLDNLSVSTNICRTVYVDFQDKVKMHGVTRSKDRGPPRFVIQQEDTINKAR